MNRLSSEINVFFTSEIVELLHLHKIYTVLEFVREDVRNVEKITKLPFKDILEVRKELLKKYAARAVSGFSEYKNFLANSVLIPTGIVNVDNLLAGGLLSGNIYELCGLPASCKTLFSLTITKEVVTTTEDKIYFIDTKQNFSARKLRSMLEPLAKEKVVDALKNVLVKQVFTKYELVNALFGIQSEIKSGLKVRTIIIDSLPVLLLDTVDKVENNIILSHVAGIMRYLANQCHICFFITNLITLWNPGDFNNEDEFKESIACGKFWYDIPNIRIKIEKVNDEKCKVKIVDGPSHFVEKDEVFVNITDVGLK